MGVLSNKGTLMNGLILGNCLDTLVRLPDKSIDLLCTDPPYGIGIAKDGQDWKRSLHTEKMGQRRAAKGLLRRDASREQDADHLGRQLLRTHASGFTMLARVVEERWITATDVC